MPGFDGPLIRAAGPMLTAPGGYPTQAAWAPEGTGLEVADVDAAARRSRTWRLDGRGRDQGLAQRRRRADPERRRAHGDLRRGARARPAGDRARPGPGQVARALGAGVERARAHPVDRAPRRLDARRARPSACAGSRRSTSTAFGRDTPELRCALDNLARFHRAGGRGRLRHRPRQRADPVGRARDRAAVAPRRRASRPSRCSRRSSEPRSRSVRRPTCSSWGRARSATSPPSTTSGCVFGRPARLSVQLDSVGGRSATRQHGAQLVEAPVDVGFRVEEVRADAQAVAAEVGADVARQQLVADRAPRRRRPARSRRPRASAGSRGVRTANPASSLRAMTWSVSSPCRARIRSTPTSEMMSMPPCARKNTGAGGVPCSSRRAVGW